MAIIKAKARQDQAVSRVSEGGDVYLRAMRDGSLVKADWKQALFMEGRGFTITLGALTDPITGGGAGALVVDSDCPEFVIGVPKGTSILPIRVDICLTMSEGTADNDELDIVLGVDQDLMNLESDGGTKGTTPVIYNCNTLHSRASNCWANQQYATTMDDPTLDLELAHVTKVFEMFTLAGTRWMETRMLYEPETPVIVNGPAMLIGYFGGTKVQKAFVNVQWLELPTTSVRA